MRFVIDIDRSTDDEVAGVVSSPAGLRTFHGWLELLAVLEPAPTTTLDDQRTDDERT
jgi:hypothetical protein